MDVLSYLDKIPVCVAYEVNGVRTEKFPSGVDLRDAKPIYEYLPGWQCDISSCRRFEDLPQAARDYVLYLEKATKCNIRYISVGPDRDAYMEK